jgi:hypothetical protein
LCELDGTGYLLNGNDLKLFDLMSGTIIAHRKLEAPNRQLIRYPNEVRLWHPVEDEQLLF